MYVSNMKCFYQLQQTKGRKLYFMLCDLLTWFFKLLAFFNGHYRQSDSQIKVIIIFYTYFFYT